MIEFNLLPDVKLEYVKTRNLKRLITLVCISVAGVSLVVFLSLVIVVDVLQKNHIRHLDQNINQASTQLQAIPDLNKILTIQNQLNSLTSLHDQKPVASRLFGYMTQLTPAQSTISSLDLNFAQHTITISGNAASLPTVNQFVDTLKFTTYKTDKNATTPTAFSDVVLSAFGTENQSTSYSIAAKFDPVIFDETNTITLTVPKITTTRSITEQPTNLFEQPTKAQ